MPIVPAAINTAWMASCQLERWRFLRATASVEETQRDLLAATVAANATTSFGRDHGFDSIRSYEQFAERTPISTYDDLAGRVDRIAAGEDGVLTTDRVLLLQPTSGSSGGRKLIPHTRRLRVQMQRAISAWIGDLFARRPALRRGRAYWSISPAFAEQKPTAGGVRVGFADDTEYLTALERRAIRRVLAVPSEVAQTPSVDRFRIETLAHLLAAEDLSLISAWSPTFLVTLVNDLGTHRERVVARLAELHPARARGVERILTSTDDPPSRLRQMWPRLALISCWADGTSADFVPRVENLFPDVELQPKGLLATEAFVSFPLVGHEGSALAIRTHFFEFVATDASGDRAVLAHELEVGGHYNPIVTTGGGLYRYRIGDVVEVVGHARGCPMLRFVGRTATADLVGEKVDDVLVSEVLRRHIPGGAILVPDRSGTPRYRLFVDDDPGTARNRVSLATVIDNALRTNPHYDHARNLGQLGPLQVEVLDGRGPAVMDRYEQVLTARGIRLGDVKPTHLLANTVDAAAFLSYSTPSP